MIVCHCRVVNDRTIRAVAADGATSTSEVGARCGAGTGCGGCVPAIDRLLADAALAVTAPSRLVARQAERRLAPRTPLAVPA